MRGRSIWMHLADRDMKRYAAQDSGGATTRRNSLPKVEPGAGAYYAPSPRNRGLGICDTNMSLKKSYIRWEGATAAASFYLMIISIVSALFSTDLAAASTTQSGVNDPADSGPCKSAKAAADETARALTRRIRTLERCVQSGDITDDCTREFQRVTREHDRHRLTVRKIGTTCN